MINKNKKNRLLSVLLAIAMIVTLMPLTVFAAEPLTITVSLLTDNVCEIDGTQYATLDAALATINEGETKTITLLKNIAYDKCIILMNKKITFVLNGYTLDVVSSIEGRPAMEVLSGGCVYLSGEGALNVTGTARGYGVTVASNTTASEVTVTNATGIGTESKAAYASGNASLTVLGDATATGIRSYGVHAQAGAYVEVRGNVSAGNQGVCVSGAAVKVVGNILVNGTDLIGNPEGIGVSVYDGVAEIDGDVTANRVGAMSRVDSNITINGMLTAPDYIQFADDAPTAIDNYLEVTTKIGYRTYQHATAGTVWILGDLPINTYALIVTNGTGSYSYTKDTVITITANAAPSGQRFKEWSITPSVTFADGTNKTSQTAKIIMPAQSVAATAIYEVLPASTYTITVQNDGNGTASANFNSAAEGAEITLAATPASGYRFKEWQVISGGITIVNNKFSILDSNVTVKAIFEPIPTVSYNVTVNSGTASSATAAAGAMITITANTAPSGQRFKEWSITPSVTFADNTNNTNQTAKIIMPAQSVVATAIYIKDFDIYDELYIKQKGLTWVYQQDSIDVGVAYESNSPNAEFRWQSYNLDTKEWETIADWNPGNWATWKAEKGNYWLHCEMRTPDGKSTDQATICFAYIGGNTQIAGTYAGYRSAGEILLGCASYTKRAGERYSFKIYDLDAKTWTTISDKQYGQWQVWKPKKGNYWVHYELYTADGRLSDTRTYCFAIPN